MTNTNTNIPVATQIASATCFPFDLLTDDGDLIAPGAAVVVGRSAISGELGAPATYLGMTLDGLAVVRAGDHDHDLGAGPGVEEWPTRFVASLEVA